MRPIFDAHLDLAWNALHWNRDLTQPLEEMNRSESHLVDHPGRGRATISLPELRRARVAVCLATILVRCKPQTVPARGADRRDLDYRTPAITSAVGQGQLAYYHLLERQGLIRIIRTSGDLRRHWAEWSTAPAESPTGVILAMEGADPIVDPAQAADWFASGLRCVGLAHYGPSVYAVGTGATGPLTDAGRTLLRELETLGAIIDLTHCAEPGFLGVLDHFSGPVHASHNMCRVLVPGDRQFSDEQIRRLVERGAVIGMAFDNWMLHPGWTAGRTPRHLVPLARVADHVDHVCQIAGDALHVGIGSDLDGGFGTEQCPEGLESLADIQKLEPILSARGYSPTDLDAIFHGNWLRFFAESLPADPGDAT